MNITVIGTGYVGLVSGTCYAELGHHVTCVDKDSSKIQVLNEGGVPIYEPGLAEVVERNIRAGRLHFTTDLSSGVQAADFVILAVGTPSMPSGEANLSFIEEAAIEIAPCLKRDAIVAIKSTVPVGTNERVRKVILQHTKQPFYTVSLPEFLREGTALQDTIHPDRIIIGAESEPAAALMTELHKPLATQIIVTDIRSAEMIKYASNAFLATKISFINEIANICEKVGADVNEVAKGMGLDKRIGPSFLQAGIGYGGSCFPKDTDALIQIAGNVEYDFKLLKSVVEVNQMQRWGVIDKLSHALGSLKDKRIAIWGLSFKPGTDDVREAPSLQIVNRLLEMGASLRLYDPIAMHNFSQHITHPNIAWCQSAMEAVKQCDAVCLLTEWDEFVHIDLSKASQQMNHPVLIDGRNVYRSQTAVQAGFDYYPVGRSYSKSEVIR
ncbi:UDP-glucose/GDP-mannose dehydrogenase family protein [Paenibacillus sp. OV219]|uniref:UDP-glucose dehydrogenase family protein n=1 Tax=Paenibacillus sp. OV219 TaxID=1884377 RepID=UPI000B871E3B|nr:UDP-glucose/GDP-mannose dehydrogenase family protein [Paenibacillus sp. OV219]